MEIDLELTEKSANNSQRWWKLTATIGYNTNKQYIERATWARISDLDMNTN